MNGVAVQVMRAAVARVGSVLLWATLACGGEPRSPAQASTKTQSGPMEDDDTVDDGARLAPIASVAPLDAWLDLLAQRPSAVEVASGRVFVDLGRLNAIKHLDATGLSAWRIAELDGDLRGARVVGRTASIVVPIDGDLTTLANPDASGQPPLALALTLRPLVDDQRVSIFLNERPIVTLTLTEGRQRRTISIPHEILVRGENTIRLHFRRITSDAEGGYAAFVESVEVGARAQIAAGPPAIAGYAATPTDSGGAVVALAKSTALAWYVIPPRRARLRLDVEGRGRLRVRVSTDEDHAAGHPPTVLRDLTVDGGSAQADLDLGGYADVPIRLEVERLDDADVPLRLRQLQIDVRRSRVEDRRRRRPRDVVIVAIEGLRARDILAPRPARVALPTFDRLAEESMVFSHAHAAGAAAVPSHAAILTAIGPSQHLTGRGTHVAASRETLAEALERAGWYGIGVSSNVDVDEQRGLTQGLADHRTIERGPTRNSDAPNIVRLALDQFDKRPSPRFSYLVISDPQAPYDPPREFGELRVPDGAPAPHMTHMWVGRVQLGTLAKVDRAGNPLPDFTPWVHSLYLMELQRVDEALGALIEGLDARGVLDETILVVVGVHGEEFREHGSAGHGRTLFDESVHVPLFIRAPDVLSVGRVGAPIDLIDLAPTLLDLVGVDPPTSWQGESLLPVVDDPQPPPRLARSHLGDGRRAVWVGRYKLHLGAGIGRSALALYDLQADPDETIDVADRDPIALRALRTGLTWERRFEDRWHRGRWGTGTNLRPAFALDHGM